MGISASSLMFFRGSSKTRGNKDGGDASAHLLDNHHHSDKSVPAASLNDINIAPDVAAKLITGTTKEAALEREASVASSLKQLSPQQRSAKFMGSPQLSPVRRPVKQDRNLVWKSEYANSPITHMKTSPSSYRMKSAKTIAYPSPSQLHSPPLKYSMPVYTDRVTADGLVQTIDDYGCKDDTITKGGSSLFPLNDLPSRKAVTTFYNSIPSPVMMKETKERDTLLDGPSRGPWGRSYAEYDNTRFNAEEPNAFRPIQGQSYYNYSHCDPCSNFDGARSNSAERLYY